MSDTLKAILLILIIAVVLVAFIFFYLKSRKKESKEKNSVKIDDSFVDNLVNLFGGKTNIVDILVEGNKLKVEVSNLQLVELEKIKDIADSGVFVTGNKIKTLFKYDANELKQMIDAYRRID